MPVLGKVLVAELEEHGPFPHLGMCLISAAVFPQIVCHLVSNLRNCIKFSSAPEKKPSVYKFPLSLYPPSILCVSPASSSFSNPCPAWREDSHHHVLPVCSFPKPQLWVAINTRRDKFFVILTPSRERNHLIIFIINKIRVLHQLAIIKKFHTRN